MTDKIRLKTVLTKFNISLQRVVNFLQKKGIEIENNPNAKIGEKVYRFLVREFQTYKEIRDASEKLFTKRIEKEKIKEELLKSKNSPQIIRAKSENLIEFKKIGKIDIDALENTYGTKEYAKTKEKKGERKKPFIKSKSIKEKNIKYFVDKKTEKSIQHNKDKPEHIDTIYQKLDGVMLTGDRIDLSQFEKKEQNKKITLKKTQRIKKEIIVEDIKNTSMRKKQDKNRRNSFKHSFYPENNKDKVEKYKTKKNLQKSGITDEQIEKQIKETLEKLSSKGIKSKASKIRKEKRQSKKEKRILQSEIENKKQDKVLKVAEFTTVNELASMMNVNATDVIVSCMSLGIMVTMNQRLDAEILTLVADEFGYNVEFVGLDLEEAVQDDEDLEENLKPRPPIITVMGHVDHGKTSLLDYIRNTNVIAGEAGGITQHIAAYSVECPNHQSIAFLDTPGHEAFTAMRARGAQITDIALIVIAADDQVRPQTKEAISHAQAANVPIIFVLNKIDKINSRPEKIREQLANLNFLVEEWGGKYPSQEISAKLGTGVDKLLEKVLLVAELLDLKANPNKPAVGTVIEASLDKGRGYVTTMLLQGGTLKLGDYVLAGIHHGKVKNILDERGKSISLAGPSKPITILGLNGAPTAGDKFKVFKDEKEAKQIASRREQLQREQNIRAQKHLTLDEIGRRIALGDFKELKIILKGDVDGSVEALADALQKLSIKTIMVNIIYKGVGQITESDILLASASDAIIIGFNVRPNHGAKNIAKKEDIEIRTYSIIYDVINDIKEAMDGMLSPEIREKILGNAEIREIFKIPKTGTIAGCMVVEGKLLRQAKVRLIREGIVIHNGEFASLKRFKEDVKEVSKGYECGLGIKNFNNLRPGDLVEVYEELSTKNHKNS
ncbi:translation initiation factor IF-2 [Blattabacterium sp. (Blatta orientalis) str. Tarazona]|uniref:translation initiation factor IF-2 n=1 Tax=Blattabacterium sp. (Blatta orientalis) TaxID=367806 RepID=UPI0002AD6E46|nr:translation initiation factor IF-2 [Blattabacterium sp. (Blatta orientalis)]AGD97930.1 translation initiation factor IF-2 [Blattabacterium sp. (Blatta orientalis) str. Tarazona]